VKFPLAIVNSRARLFSVANKWRTNDDPLVAVKINSRVRADKRAVDQFPPGTLAGLQIINSRRFPMKELAIAFAFVAAMCVATADAAAARGKNGKAKSKANVSRSAKSPTQVYGFSQRRFSAEGFYRDVLLMGR
jgi:hypothetical protein